MNTVSPLCDAGTVASFLGKKQAGLSSKTQFCFYFIQKDDSLFIKLSFFFFIFSQLNNQSSYLLFPILQMFFFSYFTFSKNTFFSLIH